MTEEMVARSISAMDVVDGDMGFMATSIEGVFFRACGKDIRCLWEHLIIAKAKTIQQRMTNISLNLISSGDRASFLHFLQTKNPMLTNAPPITISQNTHQSGTGCERGIIEQNQMMHPHAMNPTANIDVTSLNKKTEIFDFKFLKAFIAFFFCNNTRNHFDHSYSQSP